ncbi:MAG: hypothetical protein R6U31_08545 [bacterium]
MKRLIFIILLIILAASCTLLNTETDVSGLYIYTGAFVSQKVFTDTTMTEDTTYSAGAIMLTWETVQDITGDHIVIEKSIGNTDNYAPIDSVQVKRSGSYSDSILSGNTYYYKLMLNKEGDRKLMNEYEIEIPKLTFYEPTIMDTTIEPTNINIVYNDINPGENYKVILRDTSGTKLWEETFSDTTALYDGDSLDTGIYALEVSTILSDVVSNESVVSTTGITQFAIWP